MPYNEKTDITCMCGAYDHPHRLGGGECNGSAWCTSFRSIDSIECESCNCADGNECQVITGQERINHVNCECVANEIRTRYLEDEYGHLPLDMDDYWCKKEMEYRSH